MKFSELMQMIRSGALTDEQTSEIRDTVAEETEGYYAYQRRRAEEWSNKLKKLGLLQD